ncbi:hypothetical protein B0H21DRAFT_380036 [Amylocystis lapponica]|nr:hypothetical protein B0H21DRAFT_380036 [Amylocystis lapponica]
MATLQSQKKALRKSMSIALRSLSAADIQQQSQLIAHRVLAFPLFQRSTSVSCYISMPSGEVDTSALLSAILRAGKTLYVPKIGVTGTASMDFLQVYGEDDLRAFPSGTWGIKEPTIECAGRRRSSVLDEAAEQLDLILCPGALRGPTPALQYRAFMTALTSGAIRRCRIRQISVSSWTRQGLL